MVEPVPREPEAGLDTAELRQLVSAGPSVTYSAVMAPEFRIRFVTPNFTALFGHDVAEMLGDPSALTELIHPDDRAGAADAISELPRLGRVSREYRIRHADGTWRRVHDETILIGPGRDGKSQAAGAFMDVTEFRDTEAIRRESDEHVRGILENVADSVVTIDEHGCIESFNAASEEMFGYRAEEVIGRNVSMLMPPPDRDRHDAYIADYKQGGQGKILNVGAREVTARRSDGSKFAMELTVGEMVVGGRRNFIGAMRDITQRRHADTALRESEQRIRLITDAMPGAIIYFSPDRRIRFANVQTGKWLNLPTDRMIGRDLKVLLAVEDYDAFLPHIDAALAGNEVSYDMAIGATTHSPMHIHATMVPHFGHGDEILGCFALIIDTTERVQREAELQQARKMEAVGQLTGGVAHDFNNLLSIILGNLQMLEEAGAEADRSPNLIESAIDASRRAADLTHRLLAFSRRQPLVPRTTDLNRLVAEMTEILARTLGETIAVTTDFGRNLPPIFVDPAQTQNALLNFAINARDAMADGGTLTIVTGTARLGEEAGTSSPEDGSRRSRQHLMLAVSDTGTGMAPEIIERAFDPFFTTKDVGEGSGLGLSTVYGFAKQSGGHVEIRSVVGAGTTLTLYLPVAEPGIGNDDAVAASTGPTRRPKGGETILLVEDNAEILALTSTRLKGWGYEVIEATDALAARDILRSGRPIDLLFTDIVLPGGLNGIELAGEARRSIPGLKIILCSGFTDARESVASMGRTRETAFLGKPYAREKLARTLGDLLENAGE